MTTGRNVHQVRVIVLFIGLGLFSHYFAGMMLKECNNGYLQSQTIELVDLIEKESDNNRFVKIEKAYPGQPVFVYGESESTLIPMFPDRFSRRKGENIGLSLHFPNLFSAPQIEKMYAEIESGNYPLTGMISEQVDSAEHLSLIQAQYPNAQIESTIVEYGTQPNRYAFYGFILFHALGFVVTTVLAFWFCHRNRFPNTLAGKLLMTLIGMSLAAAGIWMRLNWDFDFHLQETIIMGSGLALLTGFGGSLSLAGLACLFVPKGISSHHSNCDTSFETHRDVLQIMRGETIQEIAFEDIASVSFAGTAKHEGAAKAPSAFHLEIGTESEDVSIIVTSKPDGMNDFQARISPLVKHLKERFLAQILDGVAVGTSDWTIAADQLFIKSGKRGVKEFALNHVTAFEPLGNQYAIWVNDEDIPSAEISKSAANAHVLHQVLNHFIELFQSSIESTDVEQDTAQEPANESDTFGNLASSRFLSEKVKAEQEEAKKYSLGRVLEEESRDHLNAWIVAAASLIVAGIFGYLVSSWVGLAIAVVGIAMSLLGQLTEGSGSVLFRIHENGFSLRRNKRVNEMLYDELESLTYHITQVFSNGEYTGDRIKLMAFKLDENAEMESVEYTSHLGYEVFQPVFEKATKAVAKKLALELEIEQRVEWIPGSFIYPDGIEASIKSGLKSQLQKVSWNQISNFRIENNHLLIDFDNDSSTIRLDTSKENFHPGFELVKRFVQSSRRSGKTVSQEAVNAENS